MELELRAECNVLFGTGTWGDWSIIRRAESASWQSKVLAVDGHRVSATVARTRRLLGGTAGTRVRGIMDPRNLDVGRISWTDNWRVAAGFCRTSLAWDVKSGCMMWLTLEDTLSDSGKNLCALSITANDAFSRAVIVEFISCIRASLDGTIP